MLKWNHCFHFKFSSKAIYLTQQGFSTCLFSPFQFNMTLTWNILPSFNDPKSYPFSGCGSNSSFRTIFQATRPLLMFRVVITCTTRKDACCTLTYMVSYLFSRSVSAKIIDFGNSTQEFGSLHGNSLAMWPWEKWHTVSEHLFFISLSHLLIRLLWLYNKTGQCLWNT